MIKFKFTNCRYVFRPRTAHPRHERSHDGRSWMMNGGDKSAREPILFLVPHRAFSRRDAKSTTHVVEKLQRGSNGKLVDGIIWRNKSLANSRWSVRPTATALSAAWSAVRERASFSRVATASAEIYTHVINAKITRKLLSKYEAAIFRTGSFSRVAQGIPGFN